MPAGAGCGRSGVAGAAERLGPLGHADQSVAAPGGHVPAALSALGSGLFAAAVAESVRRRPALPTTRGRHP